MGLVKDTFNIDEHMAYVKNESAVDSRDINLHYLYSQVMLNPSTEATDALTTALNQRMVVDKRFNEMFPVHMEAFKQSEISAPSDYNCYRTLIDTYEASCGKFDDYSMKYMKIFAAECEGLKSFPENQVKSVEKIKNSC